MIKSLYSGVSGLKAHQVKMDVIGHNVANVNTTGYKSSTVNFQEVFSQTIRTGSAATDELGGTNAQQVGLGVSIGSIDTNFIASSAYNVDNGLNASISGEGFFRVQDGEDGQIMYTRVGDFTFDTEHRLVTSAGYFVLDSEGAIITKDEAMVNVTLDKNGFLTGLIDGVKETMDTLIGVVNFINPKGLEKLGGNMYGATVMSGEPLENDDMVAGGNGTGYLVSSTLESSNVDLAKEFTDMIVTQRGYQANSRVITVSDTLLEELINLKR